MDQNLLGQIRMRENTPRKDVFFIWAMPLSPRNIKRTIFPVPPAKLNITVTRLLKDCLLHCVLELGFYQQEAAPLYAERTQVIQIVANHVSQEKIKHILADCHYIKEGFNDTLITLPSHH